MDPVLSNRLRQHWPIFTAFMVMIAFLLVDSFVFHPLADRYHRALRSAGSMSSVLGASAAMPALPPRVFTLLADNSLPAADADAQGQSGQLAAQLMQELSQAAGRHDLELVVTEPGVLTQQPTGLQVRAHMRLRGRYASLVAFLDDLARSGRLYRIERLSFQPEEGGRHQVEVFVERLVLKRTGVRP